MPPSRYRVIERGRRLEVIDRGAARRVTAAPPSPARPRPAAASWWPTLPRRTRFDGGAELATHRTYDDKAPRLIALDPASAAIVRGVGWAALVAVLALAAAAIAWPWLLVAVALPFSDQVRKPLRAATTRWLDRVERETQ